ncbi:aggregation-promoting factor C-terminal-like domain-containing protein [Nonomuraea africana]|uniref:aggregation-promoting factor C-terminal-like domain-containing protein n=1 Tax=Nonomuraea africana TaxID=46171 RepID=UPI00340D55BC
MSERPAPEVPRGRRRPARSSALTPKRILIAGLTVVVVFGGGGFVAYTAYQNATAPPKPGLTMEEMSGLFGSGDPFAEDPSADVLKAAAVDAMRKDQLADSRKNKPKLNPIKVVAQGPGGDGIPAANFPPGSTPSPGSNKALAKGMLAGFGFGDDQWGCLEKLWHKESGWNERAMNRYSGAYGIPQSLPGSKMASAGADWQTNAATQIKWGLGYIKGRYGTPCGAWSHSMARGWY